MEPSRTRSSPVVGEHCLGVERERRLPRVLREPRLQEAAERVQLLQRRIGEGQDLREEGVQPDVSAERHLELVLRLLVARLEAVHGRVEVPVHLGWERYAREVLGWSESSSAQAGASGTGGSTRTATGSNGARAADPDHAAARTATLSDALAQLLRVDTEEIAAGRRSEATLEFHRRKAGHLVRLFETNDRGERVAFPLVRLRPADGDRYISQRRAEGSGDATIAKEIVVLRKAPRLAIRAGLWRGRVEEVIPLGFSPQYEPRKRALTAAELGRLLAELPAPHAARVAFIVATSAN